MKIYDEEDYDLYEGVLDGDVGEELEEEIIIQKIKKEKPEVVYYVKNEELIPEIRKFKETGRMSEELGGMILKIARNLSNKANFINYTWKDDMVMEGVMTCCKYIGNFDLERSSSPFTYITTICYHSFVNYINKQKRHSEIKDKCFNNQDVLFDEDVMSYSNKAIDYGVLAKVGKK